MLLLPEPRSQRFADELSAEFARLSLDDAPPALTRPTCVYFMQIVPDGPVKIGVADRPTRRLADLQACMPYELRLRCFMHAPAGIERFLHDVLSHHRIRGEWFAPTEDVLWVVELFANSRARRPGLQPQSREQAA